MSESKRVVRQYPREFKVDAVKLLEEKGYTVSEAANSLGTEIGQPHQVVYHGFFLWSQAVL